MWICSPTRALSSYRDQVRRIHRNILLHIFYYSNHLIHCFENLNRIISWVYLIKLSSDLKFSIVKALVLLRFVSVANVNSCKFVSWLWPFIWNIFKKILVFLPWICKSSLPGISWQHCWTCSKLWTIITVCLCLWQSERIWEDILTHS